MRRLETGGRRVERDPVGALGNPAFLGSGGIGQCVVKSFAAAGADVAIVYRSKQAVAERVAAEITQLGRKASLHAGDVTDPAQVQAVVDAAIAAHGRIHTIVWAAGPLVEQVSIADTTLALWKKSIDTEVHGFFNAVQSTLQHFRDNGGGSYVHLGSAGHAWFPPKDGLSVVPKAANEALCKGIAKEEGRNNIRANSILVGKEVADAAMDAAACIGCGACVAACKNSSAMLFVAAKVSHLGHLPQGQPERHKRVLAMVRQMDSEGFGNCTNQYECEAACPKEISVDHIARMNRDYGVAVLAEQFA